MKALLSERVTLSLRELEFLESILSNFTGDPYPLSDEELDRLYTAILETRNQLRVLKGTPS